MSRILLFALLVACSSLSVADIYKWTDENGAVHFGDNPKGQAKAEKIDVKVVTYTHVTYQKIKSRHAPATSGARDVVMYGTRWCGYCKKARAHFHAQGIAFTDLDVEADADAKARFEALGGGGVPVILVGDTRINGFDAAAFDRIYNQP